MSASFLLLADTAARAPQIGTQAPASPGIVGALFALLLVLGLILGLAWLLKRLPGVGGVRPNEHLRVVASLALGAKERVMVVEVGGEQLLLGIGAGSVRTLHRLDTPLPTSQPAPLPNFAALLAQRLRKDR